ncbi:protein mono-ADP-ribosyltransferase TIPARP-like isoform X2 [Gopherus flavomarginatus]|uniref:protein mono-ADP-ribosyltransferase TIPARP-like isoform X2 n=1 Tax=Gopherus flavomarginatus TaxID=286002 RepID=UPI0021CC29AD|nr:protein mono-ADP-ribosyltransferase TIPARP-like isoform X2 [Gopherus flavomarginatus]
MAAGSDAPTALPPARLARLKRSRRSASHLPVALRTKALAQLLHHRSPEPGSTTTPAPGLPSPAPAPPAGDPHGDRVELALREAEAAPEPAPEAGPGCEELTLDHLLEIVAQLEYHTHPEDGVEICPLFLLGCCFSGACCPQHHTLLPYHWQLWQTASLPPGWLSVGPEAHETLERLYSDPERTLVRASYQGVAFDIDLVAMQVRNSPRFTRVRRLGTSPAPGAPFGTSHVYYWRALGGWQPYSQPFTQSIEAALRRGQEEALCSTAEHSYQLNLRAGYQRNLATGTVRPLRARPAFRAPALLLPELRTLSGSLYLGPTPAPGPPLAQPYPETWVPLAPEQDWHQAPVAVEERGYRLIYGLFHKSLPESRYRLERVWRVQNPFLWDKYKRKQSHMSRQMSPEQRLRNERHLFHGTSAGAVPAICKHNLDPRLSGKHAALYGQGSYFARRASYSHRYAPPAEAGLRHVFLCKVLVGRSALGQPALRRPPALDPGDPASDLYDSCVDSLSDPQIYVVFDNDQCYPYFLLQYRELEEVVKVD